MPDPDEYVRVTDKDTGHHHTIRRSELPHGNYDVLKQAAVERVTGEPLPPKFKSVESTTKVVAAKKAAPRKPAAKKAAATTSGQSAGTKES